MIKRDSLIDGPGKVRSADAVPGTGGSVFTVTLDEAWRQIPDLKGLSERGVFGAKVEFRLKASQLDRKLDALEAAIKSRM